MRAEAKRIRTLCRPGRSSTDPKAQFVVPPEMPQNRMAHQKPLPAMGHGCRVRVDLAPPFLRAPAVLTGLISVGTDQQNAAEDLAWHDDRARDRRNSHLSANPRSS